MKKPYVQFSKQMVVFVSVSVTVLAVFGMVVCTLYGQLSFLTQILESYIGYATICFAAYSGNSAIEKYLIKRYTPPTTVLEE